MAAKICKKHRKIGDMIEFNKGIFCCRTVLLIKKAWIYVKPKLCSQQCVLVYPWFTVSGDLEARKSSSCLTGF